MSKHIFCVFILILVIHFMYIFVILDIRTNKILFLIFFTCRLSSHEFYKLIIKSKKYIQRYEETVFLKFLYLNMLNHAMCFFIFIIYAKSCLVF
jgi:hypothetical protein